MDNITHQMAFSGGSRHVLLQGSPAIKNDEVVERAVEVLVGVRPSLSRPTSPSMTRIIHLINIEKRYRRNIVADINS